MANRINFQIGYSVDKAGLSEMQSLFQQIANKAKEPGNELNSGLQKAAVTANTLDGILEKTFNTNLGTLNVTKFNQELSKSGLTLKGVQSDLSLVGNQGATAYNRLAQAVLGTNLQLKESNKLLDSMAVTMANTVKWGITSSIFNSITSSIQQAYIYTKQLDTSLNDIRIVTDKSAESMAKFAVEANSAAKQMGANTLDYTNASLIYYQQGLSDAEVAARAETTIKAANVTGQTGEAVSEQLTAVWNGYKVTAEETEAYVDKLAAVAATTAADLEELSIGMSKVASAANAMGVDFDDLNAQIATIVSVTRQAPESVGTALKTIYARLGDLKVDGVDEFGVKLGEVSAQMQQMGIQILDQNGDLRDMSSVIAEVAEKWTGWTSAQRQAAAVAMAGKRQYNNLIALFDNWDMYTDALNTSTDALGTLQHQQDIYMESTAAKLKTLKATWQDLYDGLIDQDEINAGIDGLTNLVQVFDNFIESFGGGLKSITAFGVVISNIFNKQIADAINGAIQRQNQYKQNIELLQAKQQAIQNGTIQTTGSSMRDEAVAVNTQKQLDIAKEIYSVRVGLTTEEYNNLTAMQQQVGVLAEEQKYAELQTIAKEKEILGESKIIDLLTKEYSEAEKIRENTFDKYDDKLKELSIEEEMLTALDKQVQKAIDLKNQTQSWSGFKSQILAKARAIGDAEGKTVEKILDGVKAGQLTTGIKRQIIEACSQHYNKEFLILKEIEKEIDAEERVFQSREKIAESKERELILENLINDAIEKGKQGVNITQTIATVTSSLSSMAMAWSSVNSLIQTWNDESSSVGDKLTQSFITLGMTIPMVISSFNKLNEVFGYTTGIFKTFQALGERDHAISVLNAAGYEIETKAIKGKTEAEVGDYLISQYLLSHQLVLNGARVTDIDLLNEEQKATLLEVIAKETEDGVTKQLTASQLDLNSAMLANPVGITIAAIAAITAAIAGIITIYNEYNKKILENAKASVENAEKKQAEIEANEELYQSYKQALKAYEDGTGSREELQDATNKVCDAYDIEISKLDILNEKYDKVTAAIKAKRDADLEISKTTLTSAKSSEEIAAFQTARKGAGRRTVFGNDYQVNFLSNNLFSSIDENLGTALQKNISDEFKILGNDFSFQFDYGNMKQLLQFYDEVKIAEQEYISLTTDKQRIESEDYHILTEWLERLTPEVEKYREIEEKLKDTNAELIFNQYDFSNIDNLKNYNQKINEVSQALQKLGYSEEEAGNIASIHAAKIDDNIAQLQNQLDLIKEISERTGLGENELINYTDNLTNKQKEIFFSGKINFDGKENFEEINNAIEVLQREVDQEDLSVAISFREKLTSDKKLTKKQLEESAGEQSSLMEDYDTELADFDDSSRLDKLETINKIIEEKIALNQEYIQTVREVTQAEWEADKKAYEVKEKELQTLESKKRASEYDSSLTLTEEEIARHKELSDEIDELIPKIEEEQYLLEEGFINTLDDTILDNLVAGIDGVIDKASLLKELAEEVGENWIIAGDKIADFGSNFPEVIAQQENYNTLQDGSIQLTEQGKEILQEQLTLRQQELESASESYKIELEKQAEIQHATVAYYQQQIANLNAFLSNKQTAAQTEENLEKAKQDYINQLVEITGQNEEELQRNIQTNLNNTTGVAENDTRSIYEYWCSVGEAAKLAGMAYETKSFTPPGFKGGKGAGGVNVSSYSQSRSVNDAQSSSQGLTKETAANMKAEFEKLLKEAQNEETRLNTKIAEAGSATKAADTAMKGAASGTGGKSSKSKSGGGGSKKQDKDEKEYKDEFDRYWEIKKAIDATDRAIKRLDKDQENLYGYELINSLKQENQLLEQQKQHYEQLAAAQRQEAAELQGVLAGYGVAFDASGAITNYAAATTAALAEYNAAIAQYNAGLIDASALEVYEKNYEAFKKALERYETLYYQEMQDTQDKLDDIWREELANNLKAWEVEVQLKLDMKELKRGWNDFINEVTDDFQKVYQDLRMDVRNLEKDAKTFIGEDGTISTIIDAVHDVTGEIDKLRGGGSSDMFESISQAQEKLKELNEELEEAGKSLHDLWVEAWDSYLDGIDQVADKMDDLTEQFERIDDELEFQRELIELLYGPEAFTLMGKYFKGQEKNTLEQIKSVKTQKDMWEDLWKASGATMDNQANWTKDQKKYYEEWQKAQSNLNDLVLEYIQLLKDDYLNTVNKVLKDLERAITGSSLDNIATEWERISDHADKYYDSVEGAYEIQSLANKIDESIATTANLKAQQKLQALREKEINYLREKENLTEYDLRTAEARYQIALKEIALEDAQNNKTSMKLTRNEQGNWSYQYIADENDVISKRQELLDAYNDLYQLASDAYEANLEALQELQQTYLDSAREIYEDETLSEEERQQKLLELREWYLNEYALLAEENSLYRNDLALASSALLLEVYNQDQEAYQSMTDAEKELLNDLLAANIDGFMDLEDKIKTNYKDIGDIAKEVMKQTREDWTSGAQTIADLWNKNNGKSVKAQVVKAYDKIDKANEKYKKLVDKCAEAVERDFSEEGISGAIEKVEEETDRLKDKTEDMVSDSIEYLTELQYYVEQLANAWESVQDEIMNAIELIEEYLQYVGEANRAAQEQAYAVQTQQTDTDAGSSSGGSSGGGGGSGSSSKTSYSIQTDAYGVGGNYGVWDGHKYIEISKDKSYLKKKYGLATGGYTGEWNGGNSDGRLAFLHQKELVLNKDDTANFLSGISMIRDMSNLNGSISDAIANSVAGMIYQLSRTKAGTISNSNVNNNQSNVNNTFNIEAEFPNAENVNEIREALLSLPNLASQYIGRNQK